MGFLYSVCLSVRWPFKKARMQQIEVRFDGGCRPTNPGNKYGSWQVSLNGRMVARKTRFELGWGTNNEAEFESLLLALEWLGPAIAETGIPACRFAVTAITDSRIVSNRLNGRNRRRGTEAQQRMAALTDRCLDKVKDFGRFIARWERRETNVACFGH